MLSHSQRIWIICTLALFGSALCWIYNRFFAAPVMAASGDPQTYAFLAEQLLTTGIYAEQPWYEGVEPFRAWRPPFYPIFLVLVMSLGGTFVTVATIQYVLLVLSGILLFILGCQVFHSPKSGILACVLLYVTPSTYFYASHLYSEILFIFLSLLFLVLLFQAIDTRRWQWWVLAGIVFGVATLTRTIWLPMLLILTAGVIVAVIARYIWIRFSLDWIWSVGAMVMCAWLVIGPLLIRNVIVFEDFVLINTANAMNFYLGTRSDLYSGDWMFGIWGIPRENWKHVHEDVINPLRQEYGESGSQERLYALAFDEIITHPFRYIGHKFQIVYRYVTPFVPGTVLIYVAFFAGCVAIAVTKRVRPVLLLCIVLMLIGSSALAFYDERFVMPTIPLYLLVASYGIVSGLSKITRGKLKFTE
jgi:4-amino-4-deoxy-L-arabinose transferase-like glycosyltransferase